MERHSALELFKLQPVYFDFSSTGLFFFFFCCFYLFLLIMLTSLPSNPSLFILTLSPSIWWNTAADNACNWSDSHFSSVFGPDKEYCQHFADMASAGRIKWTLFCSVLSAAN